MNTTTDEASKPAFLWSLFTMQCPRCRRGNMFTNKNPYKKLNLSYILDMPEACPVCHQKYDLEPGFWYGTGYISYGIVVLFSALSFIAWWICIGISMNDNRVIWWLLVNAVAIVILQPWFMRFSRVVYFSFFVKYNANYETEEGKTFDYH